MKRKFTLLGCAALLGLGMMEANAQQMTTVLFPAQSSWKYLDNGTDQGTAWTASNFADAAWTSGNAELGYGDGDEATIVSFGPNTATKYTTTYFRAQFNLAALPTANQDVVIKLRRDDGAVVYLNGQEIIRDNMPAASTYTTFASSNTATENDFRIHVIPASALQVGTNTFAVEVHQCDLSSSDLSFALQLELVEPVPPVVCDQDLDSLHISRFVSVMPSTQPDSLRIPATHTFQMLLQEGDAYTNAADGVTKGLFDFTGYVPINNSSRKGYLSINHELGSWPTAGVSMLNINFNDTTDTWVITNNAPVDFGGIGGTGRNCSGTVTPWNTIITSEETLPTADVNNDGYQDIGWMVEIDPATHTIKDYDNDGTPDKIWGMGRMSHENCVVAPDKKTVYEGADESSYGYVWKYVAHTAGDMSSGDLFVLKLDGPIGSTTTGDWIGIPNYTPEDCNNVRTYASAVGATNFNGVEDVEISPLDHKIYFTSKATSRVYRFADNGSTVSQAEVFVGNSATIYNIETADGIVQEQWDGGVDNLTFDNEGNLYVIQDGGRNHIWMVPPCHTQTNPAVKLFAVTPAGCEPTGMTLSPDNRYMFVSMQHPDATNATEMRDATGALVKFNKESAIVIARKEFLGPDAIQEEDTTTSVRVIDHASLTSLYPNPTTQKVTVVMNSKITAAATIELYNVTGAVVLKQDRKITSGKNEFEIDMQQLPAGVYTTAIHINGQTLHTKIIKQ
jgi:secreted PhoX family phosphatase